MGQDRQTVFSFSCGGFFAGSNNVKIERIGDRYEATSFEMLADEPMSTFEMSEDDVRELEGQLRGFGVDEWFSRYWNHNVLDGTQWDMEFEGHEYCGSNSFPPNFAKLSGFLADRFECPGIEIEDATEGEFPDCHDPITHLADYCSWMGDPGDKRERGRVESLDPEELKDEREALERTHIQMLNDLDKLVSRRPEFIDYMGIVERSGIGLGLEEMRSADLSGVDADTIVAMMIYIYRADRFSGYQEDFLECMKDGTFKRWLGRLAEFVDYPVW